MIIDKVKLKKIMVIFWCFMIINHLSLFLFISIYDSGVLEEFGNYLNIYIITAVILIISIVYHISRILESEDYKQTKFEKTMLLINTAFNMLYATLLCDIYVEVFRSNNLFFSDVRPYLLILLIIYLVGLIVNIVFNGLVFNLANDNSRKNQNKEDTLIRIGFNNFGVIVGKLTQIILLYSFLLTYALLLLRLLNYYLDEI